MVAHMNDGIGVAGAAVLKKVGHVIVVIDPRCPQICPRGFLRRDEWAGWRGERRKCVCGGRGGREWRGAFALDVTENGVIMRGVHMTKE